MGRSLMQQKSCFRDDGINIPTGLCRIGSANQEAAQLLPFSPGVFMSISDRTCLSGAIGSNCDLIVAHCVTFTQ